MRHGVRIPAWYLVPESVLGILSRIPTQRDLERLPPLNQGVLPSPSVGFGVADDIGLSVVLPLLPSGLGGRDAES